MIKNVAFIALGSNLGQSLEILCQAAKRLQALSSSPIVSSSIWQTTPVDCPPGSPPFLNAVIQVTPLPQHTPKSLLGVLKEIEKEFGRRQKVILNEPRPLDLDLIIWGDVTRNSEELTLPHPRAHLRKFVLQPLNEIAPDLILPGTTSSVLELLQQLHSAEEIEQIGSFSDLC